MYHDLPPTVAMFGMKSSGWWFGTMEFYDFPSFGNVIIPTDELIFFRGVGQPPTSHLIQSSQDALQAIYTAPVNMTVTVAAMEIHGFPVGGFLSHGGSIFAWDFPL